MDVDPETYAAMLEKTTELRLMTPYGSYVIPRESEIWAASRDAKIALSTGLPDGRTKLGKRLLAWQARESKAAKAAFEASVDFKMRATFE